MKKKLRVIIITLVVLLAGTGAFLWKMNRMSKEIEEKEQALLKEERDLQEEQKGKVLDQIKEVDIIPLRLSGSEKNVVTTDFSSVDEIYSVPKSASVEENLTAIKKNKAFTTEDALWAYNPYGTNRNSMYVYFETKGNCYVRYTISVRDASISDFTRTAYAKNAGKVTKEHEYQLVGLVPGQTNYIHLKLFNQDDELSETKTFSIDIPASPAGAPNRLASKKGVSKKTISNGLFTVFQEGKKAGKIRQTAILLYDNSGVLRGEIPTNHYIGRNMEQIYDTLTYATSPNQMVQINSLGQVTKAIAINGYDQAGEFAYDGYGNIYAIATANQKGASPRSKVLQMELETGKVSQVLDMEDVLKSVYRKSSKQAKKKSVNWIDLNSIQVTGTNKLLLSSRKLSSIFHVSNVGSLLPKVNYIIADKKIYDGYKNLQKKVLTKASQEEESEPTATPAVTNILKKPVVPDPFMSQYGQEALGYRKRSAEGQYDLTMFSNNAGTGAKGDGSSYYLSFRVDETTNTYQLKIKNRVEGNQKDGNYILNGSQYIYCHSDAKSFKEADTTGRLIREYATQTRPYRVCKRDFKDFWFR